MMSSLFIGATGLKSHAEGMNVVTNNLANVNTVGFKQTMMLYEDLISQTQPARSNNITNISQVGMGAMVGDTRRIFTQGGFEKGSDATDLGITGIGFFGVEKDGMTQYTRAGNFRFTKEGFLNDPNGWTLMGRAVVNGVESGAASPIKLNLSPTGVGQMLGQPTTALTACSQLGGLQDKSQATGNPFFSMATSWDGTLNPPVAFGYRESIQLYDTKGDPRQAYIYYDYADTSSGQKVMEYVVAMDPAEDGSAAAGTPGAGLLMAGTVSFSSTGMLQNVTAFLPSGTPSSLSSWQEAPLVNGSPAFSATFSGAGTQTVALDMGLTLTGSASAGYATAADAATSPQALYAPAPGAVHKDRASTAYGTSPAGIFQTNNGFTTGYLQDLQIDRDGMLVGNYSNGESQDLYRISLYRFTSQDGLRHEGNNHFSATPASGEAQEGKPGTENYGLVSEWSLEQSNVDYAREFATMIITQRGFQMNSKVITTSDQMLQKALELKR